MYISSNLVFKIQQMKNILIVIMKIVNFNWLFSLCVYRFIVLDLIFDPIDPNWIFQQKNWMKISILKKKSYHGQKKSDNSFWINCGEQRWIQSIILGGENRNSKMFKIVQLFFHFIFGQTTKNLIKMLSDFFQFLEKKFPLFPLLIYHCWWIIA